MRTRRVGVLALGVVVLAVCNTAIAVPINSLGWWQEGAAGSTHQYWDFTPASQNPVNPDQFYPEELINPNKGYEVFAQIGVGTYDGRSNITGNLIIVDLKINNYPTLSEYKEVRVDLGLTNGSVMAASLSATADDLGITFSVAPLNPSGNADLVWIVRPNPYFEDILIAITGSVTGAPAVLDYIHVDTICIPEPATLCLMGLGALALLRKRTGK